MDDIRESFSKLKKDFKHRLGGKKRALGGDGASSAGERVSTSASLSRPDSHVAASGHNEEGTRISADISQVRSRAPSPMPADEGRRNDPQRKEAGVDQKEGGQRESRLDSNIEVAAGSGPSREDERAYPPVTLIPCDQEPDSTWPLSPPLLRLIIPSHNAGTSAVPDHTQKELLPNETTKSNAAADERKSSWKSTAYATAKLLLYGVRDSADAFGPLKSVAGGLCFILENCEV